MADMTKPNILVFMTDQQRACSVLPNDPYKAITPVLDRFREDSVTFGRAFCPSPHCCPSRASFMTGLMPTEHGVWHNVNVPNAISRGLREDVRPWSVDMRQAGYRMRYIGKWHVSNYQQPEDYGWNDAASPRAASSPDEQDSSALAGGMRSLRKNAMGVADKERGRGEILRHGYPPYVHYAVDENPHGDRRVVEQALEILDGLSGDDPWCLYVGTLGPHDPYKVPQRFLDLYDDIEFTLPDTFDDKMEDKPGLYRRTRDRFDQLTRGEHVEAIKHYLAFCTYEDWLFGQFIDKLKERGEYDDTVILYVSDHGDYLADHGLWCKGLPAFLSNYHVPAILKTPAGTRGTVRHEFVSLCDIGPTLLELAGIESPTRFTGKSLVPLLAREGPDGGWRDALFFQTNGNETYGIQRSIATDKWRFVFNAFDYDELYDLETDPGQVVNLANDPKLEDVRQEMYRRIWAFGLDHGEQVINGYIMTAMADYGPGVALRDEVGRQAAAGLE